MNIPITISDKKLFNEGETITLKSNLSQNGKPLSIVDTGKHVITNSKIIPWHGWFYQLDNNIQWYNFQCFNLN